MIVLSYTPHSGPAQDVALGDRLVWVDEFDWTPIAQDTAHSTTGALLVDVATRQAGRSITLDGAASNAWIARIVCAQLQAWAALPGAVFTLTLRGVSRPVIFDHGKKGFEARSVWRLADGQESPEQLYLPTLRFFEI